MAGTLTPRKPHVRLLFLGNPVTDRRVKNFAGLFLECGYEVELIFASPGEKQNGFNIDGAQITHLALEYSGGPKMFRQYAKRLSEEVLKSGSSDILFACELYSLGAAAEAKRRGLAKHVIYDARELYTELPTVAGNFLKKWFWKRQERAGLLETDAVIVTAPDDARAIKAVHGFLPASILVRNFPRREQYLPNHYLREYFHVPAEKKIFVYVGGLQGDRGLEKMIAAMKALREKAIFILIGDGILKNPLHELSRSLHLEETVFFHPPVDSELVIKILGSADVGISLIESHSKSYELALPSKIFEYMLAGLPILSSPLKQVKDLFSNSEGILFCDPSDSPALVKACEKAMEYSDNMKLRLHLHEQGSKRFTFETDAENVKAFLSANRHSGIQTS